MQVHDRLPKSQFPNLTLLTGSPNRIENRTWRTNYRGPLAIHASRFRRWLRGRHDYSHILPDLPPVDQLVFGAIIGVVDLIDCVPYAEVAGTPLAEPGGFCWLTENPRPLRPVICSGQRFLFDAPAEPLHFDASSSEVFE